MTTGDTRVRTKKGCISAHCTVNLESLKLIVNQTNGVYEDTERYCEDGWIVIHRKILTKNNSTVEYSLSEVTRESLEDIRQMTRPVAFYKANGKYYFSFVPQNFSFGSFSGKHCCSQNAKDCVNLSPSMCQKVFDKIKKLEKYPFIYEAFQTLYTQNDRCVVFSCSNCEYAESTRMKESEFLRHYRLDNMKFKV